MTTQAEEKQLKNQASSSSRQEEGWIYSPRKRATDQQTFPSVPEEEEEPGFLPCPSLSLGAAYTLLPFLSPFAIPQALLPGCHERRGVSCWPQQSAQPSPAQWRKAALRGFPAWPGRAHAAGRLKVPPGLARPLLAQGAGLPACLPPGCGLEAQHIVRPFQHLWTEKCSAWGYSWTLH